MKNKSKMTSNNLKNHNAKGNPYAKNRYRSSENLYGSGLKNLYYSGSTLIRNFMKDCL